MAHRPCSRNQSYVPRPDVAIPSHSLIGERGVLFAIWIRLQNLNFDAVRFTARGIPDSSVRISSVAQVQNKTDTLYSDLHRLTSFGPQHEFHGHHHNRAKK